MGTENRDIVAHLISAAEPQWIWQAWKTANWWTVPVHKYLHSNFYIPLNMQMRYTARKVWKTWRNICFMLRWLATCCRSTESAQPGLQMSGIICLLLTPPLRLCLCKPSLHALFLPGVMELHEVDATLALSLSLSTLNHIYRVQSKPLTRAVEIQTGLSNTDCT